MIHCGSRGLGHQVATGKCLNIRNILHQTSCGWSSNSARSPWFLMDVDIMDLLSNYNSK